MWFPAITTYLGYAVLIVFGHVRDFFASLTGYSRYNDGPARAVRSPVDGRCSLSIYFSGPHLRRATRLSCKTGKTFTRVACIIESRFVTPAPSINVLPITLDQWATAGLLEPPNRGAASCRKAEGRRAQEH